MRDRDVSNTPHTGSGASRKGSNLSVRSELCSGQLRSTCLGGGLLLHRKVRGRPCNGRVDGESKAVTGIAQPVPRPGRASQLELTERLRCQVPFLPFRGESCESRAISASIMPRFAARVTNRLSADQPTGECVYIEGVDSATPSRNGWGNLRLVPPPTVDALRLVDSTNRRFTDFDSCTIAATSLCLCQS